MSVYLHLGAHKTATSSLQSLMNSNRELLIRNGLFPAPRRLTKLTGKKDKRAHLYNERTTRHFWKIIRERKMPQDAKLEAIEKIRKDFDDHRQGCPNLLLSDEALLGTMVGPSATYYPKARRCIKLLRKIFADEEVRVIYYIRDQDTHLESCYLQNAHKGKVFTAADYLERIETDSLYWSRVADEIAAVVGPGNLAIRRFENIRNGFVPFAEDFFSLSCPSGLVKKLKIADIAANPGFSQLAVQIAQAVVPLVDDKEWAHFRKLLQKKFNNKDYPKFALFDDEQRAQLMARYQNDNREVMERYPGWVLP